MKPILNAFKDLLFTSEEEEIGKKVAQFLIAHRAS